MSKIARLLLVEDETDVLRANEEYLSALGYEVRCAASIGAAHNILWEYPPDLVLLDIQLPDGSGLDFCRELRRQSTAPVIFLTCLGEDGQVVTGLEAGGDDYIIKPYGMEVMAARISAQLRRRNLGGGSIILPPLYIDRASGEVTLSGRDIHLTPKELQLLCYLVDRQGQELSQAQLFEAVWGESAATMGGAVRITISRLRQKLQLDHDSYFELITTPNQRYIFLRVRYPQSV